MTWHGNDLEALYVRLEKPVYNVVYRRLWDVEESHDVVQDAFLKLCSMRERVVPETAEPLLYRVALNLARSRLRRRRLWRFLALDGLGAGASRETGDAESSLAAEQERALLRRAIDALPDDVRDVLLLSEFAQLRYAEIASALGIAEGTVGSRRNRALRLLRERFARSGHD